MKNDKQHQLELDKTELEDFMRELNRITDNSKIKSEIKFSSSTRIPELIYEIIAHYPSIKKIKYAECYGNQDDIDTVPATSNYNGKMYKILSHWGLKPELFPHKYYLTSEPLAWLYYAKSLIKFLNKEIKSENQYEIIWRNIPSHEIHYYNIGKCIMKNKRKIKIINEDDVMHELHLIYSRLLINKIN